MKKGKSVSSLNYAGSHDSLDRCLCYGNNYLIATVCDLLLFSH